MQRVQDYHPDKILYLTDKRQALHFEQVFRAAKKSGIVPETTELQHIGFGTMNGKDGKPFKTRDGGVMRLETLIADTTGYVEERIRENKIVPTDEAHETAKLIAVGALKYGDLSNLATKDYIFDIERFAAFEGNTGRICSIPSCASSRLWRVTILTVPTLPLFRRTARAPLPLQLCLANMPEQLAMAYRDSAPNVICAYAYELAGAVNRFYHETRILTEPDEEKRRGYVALVALARRALEECIDLLGFSAPDKM